MGEFDDQASIVAGIRGTLQSINEILERQLQIVGANLGSLEELGGGQEDLLAALSLARTDSRRTRDSVTSDQRDMVMGFGGMSAAAVTGAQAMSDKYAGLIEQVDRMSRRYRGLYDGIQKYFGGGMDISATAVATMNEQSASLVNTTSFMIREFAGATTYQIGEFNVGLQAMFANEAEALSYFEGLIQQSVNTYAAIRDTASSSGREMVREMAVLGKAMGYDADQTSTFIQRQISLTGEANLELLEEGATAAGALAREFQIPQKQISRGMEEVIASTERFGNVMPAEAARISTSLYMIGLDFSDLERSVGQFQGFESAASAVGNLTSVFGLNMDAMEMMMLANEGQDEFLLRMRSSFLEAGVSVDSLNQAQKQLIRDQLNLSSVESVERLLGPMGSALEEIDRARAATESEGPRGLDAVKEDIFLLAEATDASTDEIEASLQRAFGAGMAQELVNFDRAIGQTGQEIRAALGGETLDIIGNATQAFEQLMTTELGLPGGTSVTGFVDEMRRGLNVIKDLLIAGLQAPGAQIGDLQDLLSDASGAMDGVRGSSAEMRDGIIDDAGLAGGALEHHLGPDSETMRTASPTKAHQQYLDSMSLLVGGSTIQLDRLRAAFEEADSDGSAINENQMELSLQRAEHARTLAADYFRIGNISEQGLRNIGLLGENITDSSAAMTEFNRIHGLGEAEQAKAIQALVTTRALSAFESPDARTEAENQAEARRTGRTRGASGDRAIQVNLVINGEALASALLEPGTNNLLSSHYEAILRPQNGSRVQTTSA